MTEWTELKQRALLDAIKRIDNLGVQYKIIAPDGTEHGALVAVVPTPEKVRKHRPRKYPHKALNNYINPFLETLTAPGKQVFIPLDIFDADAVQSTASSLAGKKWGKGNYRTSRDVLRKGVDVLREV